MVTDNVDRVIDRRHDDLPLIREYLQCGFYDLGGNRNRKRDGGVGSTEYQDHQQFDVV